MFATRQAPVTLTTPAHPSFVRVARLVCASLAADLDFDVDEIQDVSIAVDEIVNVVVQTADPGSEMQISMSTDGQVIEVDAQAPTTKLVAELDPLSEQVLAAVTDSFEVFVADGIVAVRMRSAPGGADRGSG